LWNLIGEKELMDDEDNVSKSYDFRGAEEEDFGVCVSIYIYIYTKI